MNDLEFRDQYKRLIEVHPNHFQSQEKMQTVWRFVSEMDAKWFATLVDRIVMSSRADRFDIGEAVISERRARASLKKADEVINSLNKNSDSISDKGLETVLKLYKIKSLTECLDIKDESD